MKKVFSVGLVWIDVIQYTVLWENWFGCDLYTSALLYFWHDTNVERKVGLSYDRSVQCIGLVWIWYNEKFGLDIMQSAVQCKVWFGYDASVQRKVMFGHGVYTVLYCTVHSVRFGLDIIQV